MGMQGRCTAAGAAQRAWSTVCFDCGRSSLGLMCAILTSPMTAKVLNATNTRSESAVNSSHHRQTRQSTGYTILQCDTLTV